VVEAELTTAATEQTVATVVEELVLVLVKVVKEDRLMRAAMAIKDKLAR
jgi:hypothetical protein